MMLKLVGDAYDAQIEKLARMQEEQILALQSQMQQFLASIPPDALTTNFAEFLKKHRLEIPIRLED